MRLCEKLGISHSHFLGGSAAWDDLDRAKAIAYDRYQGATCGDCGFPPGEDPYNWAVDNRVCPGCRELAREGRQWKGPETDGLKFSYTPVDQLRPLTEADERRVAQADEIETTGYA